MDASERFRALYPHLDELWDDRVQCWVVADLADGWVVEVMPFLFTAGLVVAKRGALTYEDRWCYESVDAAVAAGRAWGGPWPGSEPEGWHRHPLTGRRRAHGVAANEVFAP